VEKKLSAREAALRALWRVEKDGAFINLALSAVLSGAGLDARDRAFASEIAYGVVARRLTLDWIISLASGRPVEKIDREVLNVLRIGAYQLFFLDRVPAPAACHTAVELVRKGGKRALAPFVNGVMRGVLRLGGNLPWPDRSEDEAGYLSLYYSHPRWLVERWLARLGSAETEALLAANNRPAPLTLRANTLKTTPAELLEKLRSAGYRAEPANFAPECIMVPKAGRPEDLPGHGEGYFQIQGESSMLVSRLLAPLPGERLLDCCSAPGGKTAHLAQLMANRGEITALDLYEHRLRLVEANCRRLGVRIVKTALADARSLDRFAGREFDRVLLDAPCSGFGVIRRKPDLKWRRNERDIAGLAAAQAALLQEAARVTSGVLVYSTCTNEPEETDRVVASFLSANPDFVSDDPGTLLPEDWRCCAGPHGIHLFPHTHGVDGFFMARLLRRRLCP
jgi:16S rRNA (cytosine967-C5)-methyltransferase